MISDSEPLLIYPFNSACNGLEYQVLDEADARKWTV